MLGVFGLVRGLGAVGNVGMVWYGEIEVFDKQGLSRSRGLPVVEEYSGLLVMAV